MKVAVRRTFSPAALRAARLAAGRTQRDVGAAIGRHVDTIGDYECGRVSPQADDIAAMAHYLGADLLMFFPVEDQ